MILEIPRLYGEFSFENMKKILDKWLDMC